VTSEVLMLNREAVVIAADSAVTTTTARDPHPRYSKAANKIFDMSPFGNVAATIYEMAAMDGVPWSLSLKLFRQHEAEHEQRPTLEDHLPALVGFLQGNTLLFPNLNDVLQKRFLQSAVNILERAEKIAPALGDANQAIAARTQAWATAEPVLRAELLQLPYQAPLDGNDEQAILAQVAGLEAELTPLLAATPQWSPANSNQVSALAIANLVKRPTEFVSYTGLVLAGYGKNQIFPSFTQVQVYGHIGTKLLWTDGSKYKITHDNDAMIQPFAQSSMIDRFTDGFDWNLTRIIHKVGRTHLAGLVADVANAGHAIPAAVSDPLVAARLDSFMREWRQENWNENFYPLRRVLNGLSVSEMAHLAESLLVLESLRERVTSPTEEVGGPIDVAVITKAEGLIWIKRKHFFDPQLNLRYLNRTAKH